jgi:peptidoglycan/LPS O-acetylase OafA/YrhL
VNLGTRGAYDQGYSAGVSSEQTPTTPDITAPRPRRLTYAALLAALEGLALVVGGVWILVLGLTGEPDDRQQAVTGGITLVVLALLPLLAARGLLGRRSWSRGPAVITQLMALPVAYNLLQADSMAIPAGIALAVVAVAALVLLVNPETTRALGIRGPGNPGNLDK